MPPGYIGRRISQYLAGEADSYFAPRRARRFDVSALLRVTEAESVDELWQRLSRRPYPFFDERISMTEYELLCPGDAQRIFNAAERAMNHKVDLLGSGLVDLGAKIDWHQDYKTHLGWPCKYFRDIDYVNPERPSDVKFPWEVSRMQWMIPLGQAYLLTGDEQYAKAAQDLIDDWITSNPYAYCVNWACTMEVALRIVVWTWFFRVFSQADAWSQENFRQRFLVSLYLHGEFTERYIERSDVNGNHFTADAAGLVFAGLFFGSGVDSERWYETGWSELVRELPRQVFPDGVNIEASTAYHRFVQELFLLPALYRRSCGGTVPNEYGQRLQAMAEFTAAYSRLDGKAPLWGDADDGRALPFGGQNINDHRYLIGLAAIAFNPARLRSFFSGPRTEVFWLLGPDFAARLSTNKVAVANPDSAAFPHGGVYIMRNDRDHVFIDCGPVGFAGRGGHGHNDVLSMEVVLDGIHLITDSGSYVYTASFDERNRFRATGSHNTAGIDGEEINRFVRLDYLWLLHDDAKPKILRWDVGGNKKVFLGAHTGYLRLANPVGVERKITLDGGETRLVIEDRFEFSNEHSITIPLHFAEGVAARIVERRAVELAKNNTRFIVSWASDRDWSVSVADSRISPSYGCLISTQKMVWSYVGPGPVSLVCSIKNAK